MPRDTGIADARAIVAGVGGHCALHRDGHVSCWGADLHGERGTAGSGESAGPVRMGGLSDAVGLSAGAEHACAVHRDGRVLCWGENLFGQLGDGTLESRATPVPVIGVNDAVEVAAGNRMFTCARRRIGSVVCWGLTERIPRTPPPRMVTLAVDDAAQVVAGPDHACVRRVGGDVLCWGINRNGQFGVLPRAHVNSPVVVSP